MTTQHQVVVIGGGYAGVTAANRLTKRDDVAVTLVNAQPMFVERIRLHQLVGGSDDAVVDFGKVLADRIRLVVDTVDRIDAARRTVILASGGSIAYDHLVYAAGSGRGDLGVTGAAEHALPIAEFADAERLRDALAAADPAAPVSVVGAGPAGIETAAELAEQGRDVVLFCAGQLGPSLHQRARRVVARRLAAIGVRIEDGPGSRVTAVTPDAVELSDGRRIPSAVTIWATGFGVPDLARRSGLTTDAIGRLVTDETLTSVDDDRIVAAGDSAAPSDVPVRMSCQAAGPLGGHAADTVLRRIAGEQPTPFSLGFVGLCLSLGRDSGIFQFEHRDDTATRAFISGRAGAKVKALVCWGTVEQLTLEARHPGATRLPAAFGDRDRRRMLAESDTLAVAGRGERK
ncbi:pyridine nucleotide-disulfide oxidoreductase [Leifsonia sp. Root227]|uniref:NAD(P)/FAD-dependent oxidoreductase n=1 Tax=unclassified Leifsonia TaxID=2663824 RepID=UPI000701D3F1|nr:FAD-dependent oxidoreductase [Leifsonia sp. Root227]KRC47059.1 pyridine nucleotide-disulfide oxidoreductase [Leifsonia sp. Root227]